MRLFSEKYIQNLCKSVQSVAKKLEMIAIQKINQNPDLSIYGIVTNGEIWEFAKLERDTFTDYRQRFDIADLQKLFNTLSTILQHCVAQIR